MKFLVVLVFVCSFVAGRSQCGACEFLTDNLVVNGDFEQGNTGFTTEYTLATVNGPWGLLSYESTYVIGSDANDYHSFFAGYDHTNPPFGDYMIVNGSSTANTEVWCQTITVVPDQWYSFSAWVRNVDTNPDNNIYANLQFFVNGVPLAPAFDVSGFWQNFAEDWYSGSETTIEICLINQQTNAGGNDFGVDDISFTTCMAYEIQNLPSAGDDQVICSGAEVELGDVAITNFSYTWLNTEGLSNPSSSNPDLVLTNETGVPVEYMYVLETDSAGLGCVQTDTMYVIVNPLPTIDLGEDQILCEGDEITLEASGEFEDIMWSTDETTSSIVVDEPGTYSAEVVALNCTSTDEIQVTVPPLPTFSLGPDTSICEDQFFTFGAPEEGLWSTGDVATFVQTNEEGWVWLEFENMGCTARDSVYLEVIEYPTVDLGSDFELCPGSTATLYAGQEGSWTTGVVADSIVVSFAGVYGVVVSNAQCSVFDEIEISPIDFPFVELGDNRLLCLGEVVELSAFAEDNNSILWSTGETEAEIEVVESGIYWAEVANQCDTVQDAVEIIFEDCDYGLYIPNAFTADGDGLNDAWKIEGFNLKEYELLLYDRWGNEVWRSTDLSEYWYGDVQNGTHYASDGIYFYQVVAKSNKNHLINRFGWVTMLR